MSIFSLCWNLLPLGGLLAGALAAVVDARFAVLIGGAVVATSALLLLTSGRLRRGAPGLPQSLFSSTGRPRPRRAARPQWGGRARGGWGGQREFLEGGRGGRVLACGV